MQSVMERAVKIGAFSVLCFRLLAHAKAQAGAELRASVSLEGGSTPVGF